MSTRRHNLCLFTNRFGHGGTEHQFAELVSRLDQRKYNITITCFSREGEFYKNVEDARLPVFEFARTRWFAAQTFRCALDWVRLVRRNRIDLLHSFDYYTNVFAGGLVGLAGVPLFVSSRRDIGTMLSPKQRWAVRRVFFRSDRVVVNSEAARQSLLNDGLPDLRIRLVRNGVDLERYHVNGNAQFARRNLGWNGNSQLIGVIANLRPEKGHRILLQAAPSILERYPNAHFIFAGPGPLEGELRAYVASNNLNRKVSFLGDYAAIPELLAALDIVVLPSTSESLPNVVLEAMSARRPVVASAVGGCTELIEHNHTGLLVPAGDAKALAQQILLLLDRPELRVRLGNEARKHAESEFNFTEAVKSLERVYDELLNDSRRPN
ncbi:MAG TPA: glycosyltransferase family 4 protein [Dongiaceae bacterium]|nr:glycosyltransferase family 4 protein [Dongiaceae bacterium]